MPIIRDIRLSFLKRKEHISSLETLKLTSSSNYDEELSFFERAVLLLYTSDICQS